MDIYDRIIDALQKRKEEHQKEAFAYRDEGKLSDALCSISKAAECQQIVVMVLDWQKEDLSAALRHEIAAIYAEWEA